MSTALVIVVVAALAVAVASWVIAVHVRRLAPVPTRESDSALRDRFADTALSLRELQGAFHARADIERRMSESVARIEKMFAGSYARGVAGENMLALALSEFPAGMLMRDFRIAGKVCEFALRLPDGKVMPIDSKWTSMDLVQYVDNAPDHRERERARKEVERAVLARVRELSLYLHPERTGPVGICALPDSVYACCRSAHADAQGLGVLLCSWSSAISTVLSVYSMHMAYGRNVEFKDLARSLRDTEQAVEEVSNVLEGQLSRALTQALNAAGRIRVSASKAQESLASMSQGSAGVDQIAQQGEAAVRSLRRIEGNSEVV